MSRTARSKRIRIKFRPCRRCGVEPTVEITEEDFTLELAGYHDSSEHCINYHGMRVNLTYRQFKNAKHRMVYRVKEGELVEDN